MTTCFNHAANSRAWKILILNGALDHRIDYKVKPIEEEIGHIGYGRRWMKSLPPMDAFRELIKRGVPLSFIREHIGVIARNFIWTKEYRGYNPYEYFELRDTFIEYGNNGILIDEYIVLSMGINKDYGRIDFSGRTGVVWTEVLSYYKFVMRRYMKLKNVIDTLDNNNKRKRNAAR